MQSTQQQIFDFYSRPVGMTYAGEFAPMLVALPNDLGKLVSIVHGLAVYDVVAPDFYGFKIPDERKNEIHIRPVKEMLDQLLALDNKPLDIARPVNKRIVGRCHHFMLFLLAMLRSKNIPARARCGFGSYFNPPYFEDHWVCEYWSAVEKRWILVDAQLDKVWREKLKIDFDVLDVPRDRFLVAGDAWERCQTGKADPSKFGISFNDMHGLWFIAGDLVRDMAALNTMEMLPWDVWGAQPKPNEQIKDEHLEFFDNLATISRDPDASFDKLRKLYDDARLSVPDKVFNALLNRPELVWDDRKSRKSK